MTDAFVWLGIAMCVSQSAMFSGLNLAVFSISRLRLQVEAAKGNRHAVVLLKMRWHSNHLLSTILWGNVSINVLLTILADSILTGLGAFFFSTVVITICGEISPQAYFSRHALRMAFILAPVLRFYQIIFYPIARPTAWILDSWLGKESPSYYSEEHLQELIRQHMHSHEGEVDSVEGTGAINFLAMDDVPVKREGEVLDPKSIVPLPSKNGYPIFPPIAPFAADPFLRQIEQSGRRWVVTVDEQGQPSSVIDANRFLRANLFGLGTGDLHSYCHHPIVITDANTPIGEVLGEFKVQPEHPGDDVIDHDVILVWTEHEKRIITGSDILGRLLRGIVKHDKKSSFPRHPIEPSSQQKGGP